MVLVLGLLIFSKLFAGIFTGLVPGWGSAAVNPRTAPVIQPRAAVILKTAAVTLQPAAVNYFGAPVNPHHNRNP